MNHKSKISETKRVLDLFRSNYPRNCIKMTSTESKEHIRVKAEVCAWLLKNDFHFWTECSFKSKQRADIVALHKSGISYCLEIVNSEKEKSILKKKNTYPLDLIVVDVKTFKYEEFKI